MRLRVAWTSTFRNEIYIHRHSKTKQRLFVSRAGYKRIACTSQKSHWQITQSCQSAWFYKRYLVLQSSKNNHSSVYGGWARIKWSSFVSISKSCLNVSQSSLKYKIRIIEPIFFKPVASKMAGPTVPLSFLLLLTINILAEVEEQSGMLQYWNVLCPWDLTKHPGLSFPSTLRQNRRNVRGRPSPHLWHLFPVLLRPTFPL